MQEILFHTLKKIEAELEKNNLINAEQLASSALKIDPKNFYSLQLMGVIKGLMGDPRSACTFFQKAIKVNGNEPRLLFNYSKALYELKKYQDSIVFIERSLKIRPGNFEGWLNYGTCLHNLSRHQDALNAYQQALSLNAKSTEAMINIADTLISLERYQEASDLCKRIIQISNHLFRPWQLLGDSLSAIGDYVGAIQAYEYASKIDPNNEEVIASKGNSMIHAEYYDEAENLFHKLTQKNSNLINAWINKGYCQIRKNKFVEAKKTLNIAESMDSNSQYLWINKGYLYELLGDNEKALVAYKKTLAINPTNPQANFNSGQIYLSKFEFLKGWYGYSFRHKTNKLKHHIFKSSKKNSDLKSFGKRIYLWGEQGIGDQILHCSVLSELNANNTYIVGLDKRLLNPLQRSFPNLSFIDKDLKICTDSFDEHAPLGNLMGIYRTSIDDFRNQQFKFLMSNQEQVGKLINRFNDSKMIIGFSWSSNNAEIGEHKSISLEALSPIFEIKNSTFIDLQYGDTSKERQRLVNEKGHLLTKVEDIDNFSDIDGLISLIELCDFVVTISNSTAHLAGALGKPTFLLLSSSVGKLWYWHTKNDYSIWYPSVMVFRQDEFNSWNKAIINIKNLIEKTS